MNDWREKNKITNQGNFIFINRMHSNMKGMPTETFNAQPTIQCITYPACTMLPICLPGTPYMPFRYPAYAFQEPHICLSGNLHMPSRYPTYAFQVPSQAFQVPSQAFQVPSQAFQVPPNAFQVTQDTQHGPHVPSGYSPICVQVKINFGYPLQRKFT